MFDYKQLARADLNLLVSFQILMEEKSVTAAAERAFVSQSAMSRTLQRLRALFNNPLFIRQSHGLIPTKLAFDIHEKLKPLLSGIDQLLKPDAFDPAKLSGQFTIACPSLLSAHWLALLVAKLAKEAPNVKLRSIETVEAPEVLLSNGNADFVVNTGEQSFKDVFASPLPDATALSLVRDNHPLVEKGMSLKAFLSYPHLRYYIPGLNQHNQGLIDARLETLGKNREIRYDGHDLETLLQITRTSDCILSLASLKVETEPLKISWKGIQAFNCPEELNISRLPLALLRLKRRESEPALRWLTKEITESFITVKGKS